MRPRRQPRRAGDRCRLRRRDSLWARRRWRLCFPAHEGAARISKRVGNLVKVDGIIVAGGLGSGSRCRVRLCGWCRWRALALGRAPHRRLARRCASRRGPRLRRRLIPHGLLVHIARRGRLCRIFVRHKVGVFDVVVVELGMAGEGRARQHRRRQVHVVQASHERRLAERLVDGEAQGSLGTAWRGACMGTQGRQAPDLAWLRPLHAAR